MKIPVIFAEVYKADAYRYFLWRGPVVTFSRSAVTNMATPTEVVKIVFKVLKLWLAFWLEVV